jgi:hypothetical protein
MSHFTEIHERQSYRINQFHVGTPALDTRELAVSQLQLAKCKMSPCARRYRVFIACIAFEIGP